MQWEIWRALPQNPTTAQQARGPAGGYGVGTLKDPKEGAKYIQKAALKGYAPAQLLYGQGLKDQKESMKFIRMAAEQGYAKAQYILGLSYYSGNRGLLKDFVTSHAWFSIADLNNEDLTEFDTNDIDEMKEILFFKMTAGQRTAAQNLAREMLKKNPKLSD